MANSTSTPSAGFASKVAVPTNTSIQRKPVPVSAIDNAVRVMSETAHDIRAPLAAVRESIQLVCDGGLGELSPAQRACLADAIDQCNCVDHMASEMVQLERLRTGMPRISRQWINIATIRHGIDQTLAPWVASRGINLVWDINADHGTALFGDVAMVRRLIVNLAINAVRATPEGGSIMIGVHQIPGSDSLQWSVVDRGRGLTEDEMRDIAARQVSHSGGEGLGLSICRQLSALHFSPLRIESRSGTGTAVSFRTAAGGPASVAERWAQWRVNQREPLRTPMRRSERQVPIQVAESTKDQQLRLDTPSVTIQLESEGNAPRVDDRAAAGTVSLGAAMPVEVAEAFDAFLQEQAGMFDLIYRTDVRTWVWVFDANVQQADQLVDAINEKAKSEIKSIRLSWTDPQSIPLDGRRTVARLTEMLVRESLSQDGSEATGHFASSDGEVGIPFSDIAAARLDREMQMLGGRMKSQSNLMRAQSSRIQPKF